MSFLQRLFGKFSPPISTVGSFRRVLEQEAECLTDGSALNNHKRSFALLVPINLFAYSKGDPIPGLERYTADSCLFELACYTLFSADIWAFGNAPHIRETVQPILSNQISHICEVSGLLAETQAFSLMSSRIEVYADGARHNSSAKEFHFRLKQALHAASETKTPQQASIDRVSFPDAIIDFALTRALVAWDMKRMPIMDALLRAVEIN